ncbi:hypothetical protein RN001_015539 [Aquatica leii]|uniref:Phospholipase A2-like domain-containing protein n=1 Tax=Aquatica leii TaxID=1421715 RepID=A0AAN7SNJ2_9COLE|nr:hypothetical protein RN001_015539 [Aquatica leii]
MLKQKSIINQRPQKKNKYQGKGLINSVIDKLPVELHIPGYNFCGPGTKLTKRLAKGDRGINKLDEACKEHDIAYNNYKNIESRHKADGLLLEKAKKRLYSTDSSLGEKLAALGVTTAMKAKIKLGMSYQSGTKRLRIKTRSAKRKHQKGLKFHDLIKSAKCALKQKKFLNAKDALNAAITAVKSLKGRKKVKPVRVIPVPKIGGFLPLIPIFAALGALGSLGGGAAAIAKTVIAAKDAKEKLKENQRHNQTMEAIALNKSGNGLYLQPYKKGFGLFLGRRKTQKNLR